MTTAPGAVIVVNYASSHLLARNLGGLASGRPDVRVVVVDNLSTAPERAAVRLLAGQHGWELLCRPNLGFGAGMNAGVARAQELGCTALLLLNPDVEAEPRVVRELIGQVDADRSALVTPLVVRADGRAGFAEGTLDLTRGTTRTTGRLDPQLERWLSGACLALSTDLWRRLGGLAEDYFMYWEDLDLSYRCQRAGGRLAVRTDLSVVHAVGGTQGAGKSALYRYYNCRNRLLFARRNLPRRRALGWLVSSPRYAWRVLLRDGRRAVLQRPLRTIPPVLLGSLAGARLLLIGR